MTQATVRTAGYTDRVNGQSKPGRNSRSLSRLLGDVRWQPDRDTWIALGSYLLVATGLVLAFRVFTTTRIAANFITFGVITLAGLGVALPVFYTVLVRQRSLSNLGITAHNLLPSLALGLLLGLDTYRATLARLGITWSTDLIPLAAMALAVGLFEAVFFRGWLQLRFEKAFGMVPALILGALCYMFYHVGYEMTLAEMLPLFGYGIIFGAIFRLTQNVFVLWPFYTPVGGLYTTVNDGLVIPLAATIGFAQVLVAMFVIFAVAARLFRRRTSNREAQHESPIPAGK